MLVRMAAWTAVSALVFMSANGCVLTGNLPCTSCDGTVIGGPFATGGGCGAGACDSGCGAAPSCGSAPTCGAGVSCGAEATCAADCTSGGCDSGGCDSGCCGSGVTFHRPLLATGTPFNWLTNSLGCAGGCGNIYWDEWTSDPPNCCDPCDNHGNWTGCNTCCGVNDWLSGLRRLWGTPYMGCGSGCTDCTSGGVVSSGCTSPGCTDCTSQHYHEGDVIEMHEAPSAPREAEPTPPTPSEPEAIETRHRVTAKRPPYFIQNASTRSARPVGHRR